MGFDKSKQKNTVRNAGVLLGNSHVLRLFRTSSTCQRQMAVPGFSWEMLGDLAAMKRIEPLQSAVQAGKHVANAMESAGRRAGPKRGSDVQSELRAGGRLPRSGDLR